MSSNTSATEKSNPIPVESSSAAAVAPSSSSTSAAGATSKLLPAPAPLINAWGAKSATSDSISSNTSKGHKSQDQWPSAEAALAKALPKDTTTDPASSTPSTTNITKVLNTKPTASQVKIKSTGKEKWVPIDATIVISSPSGSNNSNNNNKKRGNSKKKPNQTRSNQGKSNGKDQKTRATKQNSQTNETSHDSTNGRNKTTNNKKQGDGSISIQFATSNSASTTDSKTTIGSNSALLSDTTADTEVNDLDLKNLAIDDGTLQGTSNKNGVDAPSSVKDNKDGNINNVNDNQHVNSYSPESHTRTPKEFESKSQNFNNKNFHHRNSEPFSQHNTVSFTPNYNQRSRHYNSGDKNSNQYYRNSISGGYPNAPFSLNNGYNYGYFPVLNNNPVPNFIPPYGYNTKNNNNNNNYGYRFQSSRSNSQSPNKEFANLIGNQNVKQQIPPTNFNPNLNLFPYVEDSLTLVINQLNYYFSIENLVKDLYLRKQMNSQGFVSLHKLIEFNRLKSLTGGDINVLFNALNYTPQLEVLNDKVRAKDNWTNWVLPYEQRDAAGKAEDDVEKPKN